MASTQQVDRTGIVQIAVVQEETHVALVGIAVDMVDAARMKDEERQIMP